jgi:hypothetical protein
LTSQERRASEDIRWALQDAEVQTQYRGEVVVPFERRIVAHGHHAATVLAEVAQVTPEHRGIAPGYGYQSLARSS